MFYNGMYFLTLCLIDPTDSASDCWALTDNDQLISWIGTDAECLAYAIANGYE